MSLFFFNETLNGIFFSSLLLFFGYFLRLQKSGWLVHTIILFTIGVLLFFLFESRSGFLGFVFGMLYILLAKKNKNRGTKNLLLIGLFFLFLFVTLFFYKSDSSKGRKNIYLNSISVLEGNLVCGIGFGQFKAQFNEQQANYFSNHNIDNKRALLADNTFYAFNDYLQWVIETGIAGFLAMIVAIYLLVRRITFIQKQTGNKPIIIGATSSLICIGVAALFSYPLQVIPIQAMALLCTGIIIFYPFYRKGITHQIINSLIKTLFSAVFIFFLICSVRVIQRKQQVRETFKLAMTGYRNLAIAKYESLIKYFPRHGDIIYLYAEQLYYSNRLPEALKAVDNARKYYVDNKVYALKAKIEDELGLKKEAEASYLRALYMVPNRMGSRFELLNFYFREKDSVSAVQWANSILKMPVKVPSERTERILNETREILCRLKM